MYRVLISTLFCSLLLAVAAQAAPGEKIPAGEAKAIQTITKLLKEEVRANAKKTGKAERDAHAKAHGCVKGTLEVNSKLRPGYRAGVFQEGATYPAWVRYSNGAQQSDKSPDARGMAIKLMDVPGKKLSETEKYTQDFLMINHDTFFVRNAADYVFLTRDGLRKFFFPGLNPAKWRVREARIAGAIALQRVKDLTAIRYWTMTPYLMGNTPAKFSVKPCFNGPKREWRGRGENLLSQNLEQKFSSGSACFEFLVQKQTERGRQPVEDPTVTWEESDAPFVKVATLTIPAQKFNSHEQMNFCENLSYNPWHAVPEHRPLGGINRVRRSVYRAISDLRHELNREPLVEPTGKETFN